MDGPIYTHKIMKLYTVIVHYLGCAQTSIIQVPQVSRAIIICVGQGVFLGDLTHSFSL